LQKALAMTPTPYEKQEIQELLQKVQ
jgi:hypothetical protein